MEKLCLLLLLGMCGAARAQEPDIGLPPGAPPISPPKSGTAERMASGPQAATWLDTTSRETVRSSYNTVFAALRGTALGWTGDVAAGVWGDTSTSYKNAVLGRLNWIRALAGVPSALGLDTTYNTKDQQAAMMMSVNKQLNHNPPASWINYTAAGAEAASHSNLCLGFSNDAGCLELYMDDFGSGNTAAGHRRWILYPQTQHYGTGDVPATSPSYPSANAIWVFDGNYGTTRPATRDNYVAWPSPGYFPYVLVPNRWSFSYPNADLSTATVAMVRDGTSVPVVLETVQNGYGENTVVWYASGQNPAAPSPHPNPGTDTPYAITVSNVRVGGIPQNFSYQVVVFDPATASGIPAVTSLSPQSGNGISQTFTFTFSDTAGASDLDVVNILANRFLDGRFGCYLAYSQPANVLYLVNDAGDALLPGLVLNGSGTVANSYCTVLGAGSTVTKNGNVLVLTLNLAFNQANFAGDKVFYLAARSLQGGNSGWRNGGVWRVPDLSPPTGTVFSLTPSGSGSSQAFTITFRNPGGATSITNAQLLINADLNGNSACYLGYVRGSNLLYLVNDNNSGLLPAIIPGSGTGTAQNSQCILNGAGTTVAASGTDLTLTVNLTFKAAFSGTRLLYAAFQNGAAFNTDWQSRGIWTVP